MRSARILLMLRTPPPFGGGEIRAAAFNDYVCNDPRFVSYLMSHRGRSKENQGGFALWKVLEFIQHWWGLVKCCLRWRPGLVYFSLPKKFPHFVRDSLYFWTTMALGARVSGELAGARFSFLQNGGFQRRYGCFVLSRLACIRLLGEGPAAELARLGVHNTIVSDNGVPPPPFTSTPSNPEDSCFRFLFVGTHSAEKGFADLVAAAACLASMGHSFEVHCAGEWISNQFRADMTLRIHEAHIQDRFLFHGVAHGERKDRLFAWGHALVLPSYSEGQPLVILEALAFGLPVVASSVGAIPDTIANNENGFLFCPGDREGLTRMMERLLIDSHLREEISQRNRRLYLRRFTQERFLKTQTAWLVACAVGMLSPRGQRFGLDQESK